MFYPYFSFFLSSFFYFLLVFSLTDASNSQNSRGWRENHDFSCFLFLPAYEHSFTLPRFLPFLFDRYICNYQGDSWWDLFFLETCILSTFSLTQLSRSWSNIVMLSAHIKLSPFCYKENFLTTIVYSHSVVYSVNRNYLFSKTRKNILGTILWLNLLCIYQYSTKTRWFLKVVLNHWGSLTSPENWQVN